MFSTCNKMPIWLGRIPPYLIKVNKTWRIDYKSGQAKQWDTDLSVLDQNKKELARKTIFVNDPLEFMGLDIYQSNWGHFADLSFNNEQITLPVEKFNGEDVIILPLNEEVGLKLKIVQMGNATHKDALEIYSVSSNNTKGKYLGKVERDKKIQLGPLNIGYLGSETLTGLQFKSNPGGALIYPGLFFIIAGVFIAFGSKKQIWAIINASNNAIIIGGNADRAKGKFFEEFENIVKEFLKK